MARRLFLVLLIRDGRESAAVSGGAMGYAITAMMSTRCS